MKRLALKRILGCLIALTVMATGAAQGSELTRAFLDGVNQYQEEQYADAISEFLKITDAGIKNSSLFYDLGNAFLKNGDLGHAMMWYERALKLAPNDPDLKFNHKYALSLVKDEPEEKSPILRVLFFWKHMLSARDVQWTGIVLNFLLWLFFILQTVRKKRTYRTVGCLLLIVTAVFALTAMFNYYEAAYAKHAIILPSKVPVRSGFADDSTELFVLHAGTRVKIERENEAFFRIYFSKGKIGWIKKAEAGVI